MEIVRYGLYSILDIYFEDFKSDYFCDNKRENRPYYCAFTDADGIIWFIPISNQVDKYKCKIAKDEQNSKDGKCLFYHIGKVAGRDQAFLIGDMFPVSSKYIKKEYTISSNHYVVGNQILIKEIHIRASKYLSLVKWGKLKPYVNIMEIKEKICININKATPAGD